MTLRYMYLFNGVRACTRVLVLLLGASPPHIHFLKRISPDEEVSNCQNGL